MSHERHTDRRRYHQQKDMGQGDTMPKYSGLSTCRNEQVQTNGNRGAANTDETAPYVPSNNYNFNFLTCLWKWWTPLGKHIFAFMYIHGDYNEKRKYALDMFPSQCVSFFFNALWNCLPTLTVGWNHSKAFQVPFLRRSDA